MHPCAVCSQVPVISTITINTNVNNTCARACPRFAKCVGCDTVADVAECWGFDDFAGSRGSTVVLPRRCVLRKVNVVFIWALRRYLTTVPWVSFFSSSSTAVVAKPELSCSYSSQACLDYWSIGVLEGVILRAGTDFS